MLELANLLSSIFVTPVTELCIRFLKRPIGYIVHCEENLKQLKKQITELEGIRDDVKVRVTAAEMNLECIHEVVKAWLKEVEKEISTSRDGKDDRTNILGAVMNDEAINMINSKCWCSCASCSTRYNLGKRAKQKLVTIEKLLNDGKSFSSSSSISEPCVISSTNPMPTNNLVSFASRKHLRDEVMAALREDKGTNLIVVHGMGGVGKTTLVNQVQEHIVNERNELFDTVVKVIVSHGQLEKIQNDIAEVLGLTVMKTKENASVRANLLSERLMKKNNLVILDDLWSPLNFSDVGIPCGATCKVIITTRKLDACSSFHNKKTIITVKVLSEEDSWQLFKKSVGDLADSSVLGTTPRDVAKECGGLPVALFTLGSGLRDKGKPVWDNTLHQLRNSIFPYHIEGMEPKVFCSIKLSYENLGNEILKKCFLLCCLFPEDHEIRIYELMAYVMGDDRMFDDQETVKQSTDRVYTMLDKLVDSCLLLGRRDKNGSLYVVSMHDVIRDVAINIAIQEGHGFFVKASVGLKKWPSETRINLLSHNGTGKWLRLSLMCNDIRILPDEPPELPQLLSLSLYGNTSLKEIPKSFFQRMESLVTLDLRETGISSLPSSLSFLLNLKTLYLDGCKFNQPSDISVIGMLKKLNILSLANCDLRGLPGEIRGLTNLRLLNLEGNNSRCFTIPQNVIRSLSRLEYLNTTSCNIKWEVEGWGNGSCASLEEVASLDYLSGLDLKLWNDIGGLEQDVNTSEGDIHIHNEADINTKNLKCGHVKKFSISFSDATSIVIMSSNPRMSPPSNKCEVDVSPPVCRPIKVLIQRVEILRVYGGLRSLGQFGGGFNNLKDLYVGCKEMEYLMSMAEAESTTAPFVALEKLSLYSHKRLKGIFLGPIPIGWTDKLRDLVIRDCNELVSIFDPNLGIRSAPNLESLDVWFCRGLKDVFNLNINIEEAGLSDVVTFSRLRKMSYLYLPILENIWNGHNIPFRCFEKLEEMEVSDCGKLTYLFSPSMVRNIQNLKLLKISNCRSMVNIISSIDQQKVYGNHENGDQPMLMIFPNLRILYIQDCENLKQLWEIEKNLEKKDGGDDQLMVRASILDFPVLESLEVFGCKNLKKIRLTHRCTEQLKEIKGDDNEWFRRLEWEEPSDKLRLQPLFRVWVRLKNLHSMVQGVWSDNFELQLEFTTQFTKLLSEMDNFYYYLDDRYSLVEGVIKAGVVPRFVEFLERQDLPQLQFEAAWALTMIASRTSKHTQVVIDHGAVPKFVQLLGSSSDDVREQAVRALGNVSGASPSCRDLVLGQGALMPLLSQLNEHSKLSMLRSAAWTLSKFFQGKPPAPFEQVRLALPILRHLIHSTDKEVLRDACRALCYLSDGTNDTIQAVIDAEVCPRLVELFLHPLDAVQIPSLQTFSNIFMGDDAQTQFVLNNQVFPCLYKLLTQNHRESIKKEACRTISNIIARNRGQIQAVIKANIIAPLVHILQHAELEIKKKAACAISNATLGESHEQIQYLVNQGCIKPLCDLLVYRDPMSVTACLEGLDNILKVGEVDKELGKNNGVNIYAQMIDECEGLDKIKNLQSHDNNEINEKALKILERYWVEDEQNPQDGF